MQPLSLTHLLRNTKIALMIIDVQNEFCHPEGSFAKMGMDMSIIEKMLAPLDRLIDEAHNKTPPRNIYPKCGGRVNRFRGVEPPT